MHLALYHVVLINCSYRTLWRIRLISTMETAISRLFDFADTPVYGKDTNAARHRSAFGGVIRRNDTTMLTQLHAFVSIG